MLVMSPAVQADIVAPFGTYDSYGIWYDRDGVSSSQAAAWGAVNGGTYNTGGIYNVVITYHAVDANRVTMFATINGIQQGFYTAGYKNAQPDIYPAGLSFTTGDYNGNLVSDITEMQVFTAIWGTSTTFSGTAVFKNMQATGTTTSGQGNKTKTFGPVTYSGLPTYPANPVSMLDGSWNLTAQDLVLSYTADFSGITGSDLNALVFAVGLEASGLNRRTPPGGGWMGNVVANTAASPGVLGLNDKFDLQNGWTDETAYNVTVPEPGILILLGIAMSAIGIAAPLVRKI